MYGIEKVGLGSELMRRMGETTGANIMRAVADRRLGALDLRDAVLNCSACDMVCACEAWLEAHAGETDARAPAFCRNADLMDALSAER